MCCFVAHFWMCGSQVVKDLITRKARDGMSREHPDFPWLLLYKCFDAQRYETDERSTHEQHLRHEANLDHHAAQAWRYAYISGSAPILVNTDLNTSTPSAHFTDALLARHCKTTSGRCLTTSRQGQRRLGLERHLRRTRNRTSRRRSPSRRPSRRTISPSSVQSPRTSPIGSTMPFSCRPR